MTVFDSISQIIHTPMAVLHRKGDHLQFQCANPSFTRLVGYTEAELRGTLPSQLFASWNDSICFKKQGTAFCNLNPQKPASQSIQLRLTWQYIEDSEQPSHLIIAEDISAKSWINELSKSHKVLISGVTSPDFIVRQLNQNYPLPMIDEELPVEQQSAFSFIEEGETDHMMRVIEQAVNRKRAESLIVRTKLIAGVCKLEVHVTFCPFFNGNGSLEQYAFVVTDLRPIAEKSTPSVTLKVLMARHNISTQQLSDMTGISQQTISKLRNGKIRKPQRLTAELIAAELLVAPRQIWPD